MSSSSRPLNGSSRIPPATSIKRPPARPFVVPSSVHKPIGSRSSSIISGISSGTPTVNNKFHKDFRPPRPKATSNGPRLHASTASSALKTKTPINATPVLKTKFDRPSLSHSTPSTTNKQTISRQTPLSVSGKTPGLSTIPPKRNLSKFANPIECQRQFQSLTLKIQQLNEIVEVKNKEIDGLGAKLEKAVNVGTGYAVIVQNFTHKLKLFEPINLIEECRNLKVAISELKSNSIQKDELFKATVSQHETESQQLHDAHAQIQAELEQVKVEYTNQISELNECHTNESQALGVKIAQLEEDLSSKCSELATLNQEFEEIKLKYDTLEESLTKDSDYRMKHFKEKIVQLEKEVDSLNVVIKMRQERIHELERENLEYEECKNDLSTHKEVIKSLNQQLESVNAALDRKREHCKKLGLENERLREDLEHENQERQKIAMRTEQLEYSLTESCCDAR